MASSPNSLPSVNSEEVVESAISTAPCSLSSVAAASKVRRRTSGIEKPRPLLKTSSSSSKTLSSFELSSVENALSLMENVARNLEGGIYDEATLKAIVNLSASLKSWGSQLDVLYKENMDKCQIAIRNAARDDKLEMKSRLHLLEIIELRATNWKPNESLTNYYKHKIALLDDNNNNNYFYGSGPYSAPVMGSAEPPSFSSVSPGSKDRLVQITGPTEGSVEQAKSLIDNTILRNQSPSKELPKNASAPPSKAEYKYTINVGGAKPMKITGNNLEMIKTAKILLEEYFEEDKKESSYKRRTSAGSSGDNDVNPRGLTERKSFRDRRTSFVKTNDVKTNRTPRNGSSKSVPIIKYDRKSLYEMADYPASKTVPENWNKVTEMFPDIARKVGHENLSLPVDWELNFLFAKNNNYSQHCDRRKSSPPLTMIRTNGFNSRA